MLYGKEACPKCGHEGYPQTVHCEGRSIEIVGISIWSECVANEWDNRLHGREHLHKSCERCGGDWIELCHDSHEWRVMQPMPYRPESVLTASGVDL